MTALRPDQAPAVEPVSNGLTLTELLSARTPTGAPALRAGGAQTELGKIIENMSNRVLSAGEQEPVKLELPAER